MTMEIVRKSHSPMQQDAGIASQIAYAGRGDVLLRPNDDLSTMTFHGGPMLELVEILRDHNLVTLPGNGTRMRRTAKSLVNVHCASVTDEVEPVRKLRALLDEKRAENHPRYSINLDDLKIDDSGILGPITNRKPHGKASKDPMFRLNANAPCVQRALNALCRQQMATNMDHQDYLNGLVPVNFPLNSENLGRFAAIPDHQLVGFLDQGSVLHSFGIYFTGDAPEFAGGLINRAHAYARDNRAKTYLYLVLVSPDRKNQGYSDAVYQQLDHDSAKCGNVGCAIEIHQINFRSIRKHMDLGFKFMHSLAEHQRTDASGNVRNLIYGQYYRPVSEPK